MERKINGEYKDPESTRDLLGLLPTDYRILIDLMREGIKQTEALINLPDEDFIKTYKQMFNVKLDLKQVKMIKDQCVADMSHARKMMLVVNEPYENAIYMSSTGQVLNGGKGKILPIEKFAGCEHYKR